MTDGKEVGLNLGGGGEVYMVNQGRVHWRRHYNGKIDINTVGGGSNICVCAERGTAV